MKNLNAAFVRAAIALSVVGCAKEQQTPTSTGASPASSSSPNSSTTQDLKTAAKDANNAVVKAASDVEKGAAPGTRKLNEGADAVDNALKGK